MSPVDVYPVTVSGTMYMASYVSVKVCLHLVMFNTLAILYALQYKTNGYNISSTWFSDSISICLQVQH